MGDTSIKIPLNGLKEGVHEFKFVVENSFFEQFLGSIIQKGKVNINVLLNKQLRIQTVSIKLDGEVVVECDLCLDPLTMPIIAEDNLYVKFGSNKEESTEDLFVIGEHEGDLNLSQRIFENIELNIPLRKVHPINENGIRLCNDGMIAKLEEHEIKENSNKTDPRWDQLKNILSNN